MGVVSVVLAACAVAATAADAAKMYVKKGTWHETMLATRRAVAGASGQVKAPTRRPVPDFGTQPFTVTAWVRTTAGGTILAKFPPRGGWAPQGKSFFVRQGKLGYDIGMVGMVGGRTRVADGKWHHVALTKSKDLRLYVDGRLDGSKYLDGQADRKGSAVMIGYTSLGFPVPTYFTGDLDEIRVYDRALGEAEIKASLSSPPEGGLVGHWAMEGLAADSSGAENHATETTRAKYVPGKVGQALRLAGRGRLVIPWKSPGKADATEWLWARLMRDFAGEQARGEMAWEREDGIWPRNWRAITAAALARNYARAAHRSAQHAQRAKKLGLNVAGAREQYLQSRRIAELTTALGGINLDAVAAIIKELHGGGATGKAFVARLAALRARAEKWQGAAPAAGEVAEWKGQVGRLRRDVVLEGNPLFDFDKLVFVKRLTYSANHYYTEYINSRWTPGGNLCVLDLKTGKVTELVPELKDGVFERFDVSFDADKIVFAWKCAHQQGYRIYEIGIDPVTGRRKGKLRQLTFPQKNEARLVELYRARPHYHHGTDDMHPCYLPNGEIVFISTRCQYGILCDAPDDFTTTVLYRMDGDRGAPGNMRKLSNSSVSEASPVVMLDGRILYTRWEYVDKGAVSVKCIWAMRPDGSGSMEIYGNDISLPPTFIYSRPIPDVPDKYVFLGTPHCPQNGVGTVIRLDMSHNIRNRDPMTYMTPYVDIRSEPGFAFCNAEGQWRRDGSGRGPLFKDPYPLSEKFFLVAYKPEGTGWNDPKGYGLYLLDETGKTYPIHRDAEISCWQPFPLKARKKPRVPTASIDGELAAKGLARCVVLDVYRGLEGVGRGEIKYIRVLEQVPRPWACRRRWGGDGYDQQHVVISKDTHLGLKVQHGVVPVEDDGSAHFLVPADANIFLQALDANYMAVQTERTYVNFIPGEIRSCVGCHETQKDTPALARAAAVKAMGRQPSVPGPQLGEMTGGRPIHYPTDVQPVLDKYCIKCHAGEKPKAGLDLSGTMTALFSRSYESLIPERRRGKGRRGFDLIGPTIGENHPKTGNVHYMPAKSFGSYASVLVAMHSKGKVKLADPKMAAIVEKLAKVHKAVTIKPADMVRLTNWVDTNGQYYGSWWGRRNLQYKDHPNFRPTPTYKDGLSYTSPIPEEKR